MRYQLLINIGAIQRPVDPENSLSGLADTDFSVDTTELTDQQKQAATYSLFAPKHEVKGPSEKVLKFIAKEGNEGFRPEAYWDKTGKRYTIGHGTTVYKNGQRVKKGDTITPENAWEEMRAHAQKNADEILALHKVKFTQNQLDALISFVYNLGITKYKGYTLRKVIEADPVNYKAIGDWFEKYVFSGETKLTGLVKRRAAEVSIYQHSIYAA